MLVFLWITCVITLYGTICMDVADRSDVIQNKIGIEFDELSDLFTITNWGRFLAGIAIVLLTAPFILIVYYGAVLASFFSVRVNNWLSDISERFTE